jgi:hypothetical protein
VFQLAPNGRRLDLRRGVSRDSRGKGFGPALWDYAMFDDRAAQGWRFRVVAGAAEPAALGEADAIPFIVLRGPGAPLIVSVEDETPAAPGPDDGALVFAAPPP